MNDTGCTASSDNNAALQPLSRELDLCEACARIPFEKFWAATEPIGLDSGQSPGPDQDPGHSIGKLSEVISRLSCTFCQLVKSLTASTIPTNELRTAQSSPDPEVRIRPPYVKEFSYVNIHWVELEPLDSYVFCGPHAILDLNDRTPHQSDLQWLIQPLKPTRRYPTLKAHMFGGTWQYLDDTDFASLTKSASDCEASHVSCAVPFARPELSHAISLIDVETMCLVKASRDTRYIALSYVWGPRRQSRSGGEADIQIDSHGGRRLLPDILPATIRDALTVVQRIGERYLWVDSYCIDQTNVEERDLNIKNMDHIYENAYYTICVFAGDSGGGIPGISRPFVAEQSYENQALDVVVRPKSSMKSTEDEFTGSALYGSQYLVRGWIFQENLLSRRRLAFTSRCAVLLCNENAFHPRLSFSRRPEVPNPHMNHPSIHELRRRIFSCSVSRAWDFRLYKALVGSYSARKLSYQSDAYNAIAGIFNRLSACTGTQFVRGLPKDDLVNALLWEPEVFATESPRIDDRWAGFPSWSWLGFCFRIVHMIWLEETSVRSYGDKIVFKVEGGTNPPEYDVYVEISARAEIEHSNLVSSQEQRLRVRSAVARIQMVKLPQAASIAYISSWRDLWRAADVQEGTPWPFWAYLGAPDPSKEPSAQPGQFYSKYPALASAIVTEQASQALESRRGFVDVVLLMRLDRIVSLQNPVLEPVCGSIVIGMIVLPISDSLGFERAGIVAIPYDVWLQNSPEQRVVEIE